MADLHPPSDALNIVPSENLRPSLGTKRQRRPSVRLGDIGEPSAAAAVSYEAYLRRNKQWKVSGYLPQAVGKAAASSSSSKTRPLLNIGNGELNETHELLMDEKNPFGGNLDSAHVLIGSRKGKEMKPKRGSMAMAMAGIKRVRSNWVSRVDEGIEGEHEKLSVVGGRDEGFQDYDVEGSESPPPSKEYSPVHSMENVAVDLRPSSDKAHGSEKEGNLMRRAGRGRVSEIRDPDAVELDEPSDMDGGDWRCGTSLERNGARDRRCSSLDGGVRLWLNGLGLGRYAQVFEIHEVEDEVLPLLTFEDLKDMGINAVGSRRKMYCSIQKLRKGFS